MNTQYQEKYKKKHFQIKTHLNIQKKKKDERNQETVKSSWISFCFSLVVFNSALDRPTQQIFTHYAETGRT